MISCRAAVLRAPKTPMTIETITLAPLGPRDVLVRVGASSLCHTDLEVIDGQLVYPMPIVLGHETAGTIEQVGAEVDAGRIGERVVLSWNPHCGRCFQCDHGKPILCEDYLAQGPKGVQLDGKTRLSGGQGSIATMFFISGFAEYAVVSSDCAVAIPQAMPFDRACLIGCAVMTGVGAARNIASVAAGETVMVIGCGAVGLAAVQGASLAGSANVLAVDPLPDKRALALRLGATHVASPQEADRVARQISNGRGADVVIECAGRPDAFRLSVDACRVGGRVVWLGKINVDEDITFRWGSLMGEKQIVRSSYGGANPQVDFPALAKAYLDGSLDLDAFVSRRISLDEINEGFEALRRGEVIRCVIQFE